MIIQKIIGKKHGDTEIIQKETIEATRTKQINRIEHERHKKQCELQGLMASTSLSSMLKVFKMWEKMKVFPILCFSNILCYHGYCLCTFVHCDFLS